MALGMELLQVFIITYSKRLHTYSRSGSPEHTKISRGVSEVSSTGNNFCYSTQLRTCLGEQNRKSNKNTPLFECFIKSTRLSKQD